VAPAPQGGAVLAPQPELIRAYGHGLKVRVQVKDLPEDDRPVRLIAVPAGAPRVAVHPVPCKLYFHRPAAYLPARCRLPALLLLWNSRLCKSRNVPDPGGHAAAWYLHFFLL
jgi:hypothetical protein